MTQGDKGRVSGHNSYNNAAVDCYFYEFKQKMNFFVKEMKSIDKETGT